MSAIGTNAKCRLHQAMSEVGCKAENICSLGLFRILTRSRRRPCSLSRAALSSISRAYPLFLQGKTAHRVLEMVEPKLDAHYSVLGLIWRVAFYLSFSLLLWFYAAHLRRPSLFAVICYITAAVLAGAALKFFYRLLTARGQVVVSIDATGFRDTRLTPAVIPWSVIQSVSPYIDVHRWKATGVDLVIDPAFKQSLSIRLGAKLWAWANLFLGSVVRLDTSILDVGCDEIARVADSYISKKP